MNKNHNEPNYPHSRAQNNNLSFSSVDSNKYKIEGNGKSFWLDEKRWRKLMFLAFRVHRRFVSVRNLSTEQANVQRKLLQRQRLLWALSFCSRFLCLPRKQERLLSGKWMLEGVRFDTFSLTSFSEQGARVQQGSTIRHSPLRLTRHAVSGIR